MLAVVGFVAVFALFLLLLLEQLLGLLEVLLGLLAQAFEALQLMRYFNEFLSEQPLESDIFTDPDKVGCVFFEKAFLIL